MMNEGKQDLLNVMVLEYHIVKFYKERCNDITPDQMEHVSTLVKVYNAFVGVGRLKASGCNVPHIIRLTGKLLAGHGMIEEKGIV